jgi:hypothetical protein
MGISEGFEIEILTKESLKETLLEKKNPRLVAKILDFIEDRFIVKIGDIIKIGLEFADYHGKICYITVEQFVPVKIQRHERLYWSIEEK